MINRNLSNQQIEKLLEPNKALIIYGPRRVGKTTCLLNYLHSLSEQDQVYFETGEDSDLQRVLTSHSVTKIKNYFSHYQLVIIDEAQYIPQVGQALKLLVDQIPNIRVIASGSSSFDLANQIGEPLTGRKKTYTMYPISILEYKQNYGGMRVVQNLELLLRYGLYPEVLNKTNLKEKAEYLDELVESYLYKDILKFKQIRHPEILTKLLRLIAFQIGHEVSLNELGNSLEISKQTVKSYLDLLQKTFVIKEVSGFSRNLRKEVTKMNRYYFYDNGILNAILQNYHSLELRNDVGQLWENFLFMERLKYRSYTNLNANQYFWRTWNQQEIDLVEERGGKLYGYEFKWGDKQPQAPSEWQQNYSQANFQVINQDNFFDFITINNS